ncbi:S8 family peptidase [Kitasatospora herbaricolor]|uniref:S8 family serine peptidase n=1 Tax=Kitasatospora herbaricolor TaxID=68217 RepID=A0ABZ1W7S8_9ACTN|nr:S8 family serine peptidase [Kitasatospora herbaricolor]
MPASPYELVRLTPLMQRGPGRPGISVAVIDGAVARGRPEFAGRRLVVLADAGGADGTGGARSCGRGDASCLHGTFVAGLLGARRSGATPGICPGCTLLVRPIFAAAGAGTRSAPAARAEELAAAIVRSVDAGARVLNLSVAPAQPSGSGNRALEEALDHAAGRGVITVVAAGNQGAVGTSVLTRHPWTIPVVAYDARGRPMGLSNLSGAIGSRGVGAPGERVRSLGAGARPLVLTGTSAATPFVTGTVALLLSEFPDASAAEVRAAVVGSGRVARGSARRTVVPPLLDAWGARSALLAARRPRSTGRRAPAPQARSQ